MHAIAVPDGDRMSNLQGFYGAQQSTWNPTGLLLEYPLHDGHAILHPEWLGFLCLEGGSPKAANGNLGLHSAFKR